MKKTVSPHSRLVARRKAVIRYGGAAGVLLLAAGAFGLPSVIPALAGDAFRASLLSGAPVQGQGLVFVPPQGNVSQPFPGENAPVRQVSAERAFAGADDPAAAIIAAGQPVANRGPVLDPVETAALYYYARERQTDRVDAEIRRLQTVHPGFVPPNDLYIVAAQDAPDETSLWQLYTEENFAGIDAEIIRRKQEDPAWEPSADFSSKLARKQMRIRMKERWEGKDWRGVLAAGSIIDPAHEPDVDIVWMMIDAWSELGDRDALARAFRALITREGVHRLPDDHLVVTMQKALKDFPSSEIRQLITVLWPEGMKLAVSDSLQIDLVRKEIAEFNAEKDAPVPADHVVSILAEEARRNRRPEDLSLIGWFFLKVEKPAEAEPFFKLADTVNPGPDSAKGYYLSLERQKKAKEAFEFAAAHVTELSDDPVFLMNVLSPRFGEPEKYQDQSPISEDTVRAYSTAIVETSSADHGEILGWYAYNSRQFPAAEAWFRQSAGWEISADRIKGLALTFLRLDKRRDYLALKKEFGEIYPDIWPEIAAAPAPKPSRKTVAAVRQPQKNVQASYIRMFEAKNYTACLREIDRLGSQAGKTDVALIRGWCELGLRRFGDARVSFERAMAGSGSVRTDAVYGAALAYNGARLTDEAEALISAYPLSPARDREIRSEIYFQRARSAFDREQYDRVLSALDARARLVREPRDLTQMRAWALYHLGHTDQAKAVFRDLNMVVRDPSAMAAIGQMEESGR